MKKNYYWIGKYESDVNKYFFYGSITYYGTNKKNNISYCPQNIRIDSKWNNEFIRFIANEINNIISINNKSFFMFYNPNWAYEVINISPLLEKYIVCLNDKTIVSLLNNKVQTKIWMSNFCDIPPFKLATKLECRYSKLVSLFKNTNEFIIQENISSGGKGTFILNKHNEAFIQSQLNNSLYLVSPRIKNSYPVNIHISISKKEIIIFPPSLQIIQEKGNKLLYVGADFVQAKSIPLEIVESIKKIANKIGKQIQSIGYRGFLGIDFIVDNKSKILFVEVNPRFQGSSILLNRACINNNLKSIYELNKIMFNDSIKKIDKDKYEKLNVNESLMLYKKAENNNNYNYLYSRFLNSYQYEVLSDGYKHNIHSNFNAYLFRTIIKRNICYINPDCNLNIVENLLENNNFALPIKYTDDLIRLKISLIIQGVRIEKEAIEYICKKNTINEATFNAVDITIFNEIKINSPVNISFVEISPFNIQYNRLNKLELYYNDQFISSVKIDIEDKVPQCTTKNLISYNSIALRTNDRVRIRHNSVCNFKLNQKSCSFCESKHNEKFKLPIEDIKEVIDFYESNINFRHYLIGGASGKPDEEYLKIIEIASYIRSKSNKPIYVMAVPPKNKNLIKKCYDAGVTEMAFNLEVYDRKTAEKIMPGKGHIPMSQYISAFEESVIFFGNTGNVRSMFIIGLESQTSLISGIEYLASIGVSPMLSVLRPMPNTIFSNSIPDSVKNISELYKKAKTICQKYNLELGPSCKECQNNTIALPKKFDEFFNN